MREMSLLNNRQPGRRRGRAGGQRPQGNGGRGQEQGNRVDNRARGNAPQLLEKYKSLARDAQMQGDRVMTETYLQYADHYFRVVAETRARYEEANRGRDDWQEGEAEVSDNQDRNSPNSGNFDDDDGVAERNYEAQPRQQRQREPRPNNNDNRPRESNGREPNARDEHLFDGQSGNRSDRSRGDRTPEQGDENNYRRPIRRDNDSSANNQRPANPRREGYIAQQRNNPAPAMIDVSVLPPAFGGDAPAAPKPVIINGSDAEGEAVPKRRGRPKKIVVESDIA